MIRERTWAKEKYFTHHLRHHKLSKLIKSLSLKHHKATNRRNLQLQLVVMLTTERNDLL